MFATRSIQRGETAQRANIPPHIPAPQVADPSLGPIHPAARTASVARRSGGFVSETANRDGRSD